MTSDPQGIFMRRPKSRPPRYILEQPLRPLPHVLHESMYIFLNYEKEFCSHEFYLKYIKVFRMKSYLNKGFFCIIKQFIFFLNILDIRICMFNLRDQYLRLESEGERNLRTRWKWND